MRLLPLVWRRLRRRPPPAGLALAIAFGALLPASPALALDDGLARTPPMGWNAWYRFKCQVNERLVRQTADAIVATGMRARGYRYVNLDDCWMAPSRDATGALAPHPTKFPSGISALADYVHQRGLKLGIYIDAGTMTCARFPGSKDHFEQDAATLASWGVDYVKMDWCHTTAEQRAAPALVYAAMRDALARTGRPMVFSITEWGRAAPWRWGPQTGHLWRTSDDFPRYGIRSRPWTGLMAVLDRNAPLAPFAGPGGWNDPDILQVGNPRLTPVEWRSLFSLWSIMAAPLLAGSDLRAMSPATRQTLLNREVIAVDQDPAGVQGRRVSRVGAREVWVRRLANGDRALLFFNRGARPAPMGFDARRLGLARARRYLVRDLWAHRTTPTAGPIRALVRAHGVAMFRVRSG